MIPGRIPLNIFLISALVLGTNLVKEVKAKERDKEKCPTLTECPFGFENCLDDEDCNPDSLCCNSPCGNICTKQLHTGCEILKRAESRRAKSLGDAKSVRIPRCTKSGSFEPIQCDNEIVSSCWCVDEQGFELPGTRAPAAALVNCTKPKSCAAHTCRMFCPHGFALTPDGCPLCKCRDPCEDIKCPNSLSCQIEDLACKDPPCPPIPTCKRGRSLENICPVGDPLRISDTIRPFLCGNEPSKPTCPPMYQCLVQKGNDYGVCCPASLQIKKAGNCPAANDKSNDCGTLCTHDLECPSVQKCCNTDQCGSSCVHPKNITECIHQKSLSELLAVSERVGKGYIPQCTNDGQFEPKQCSRNGLVCWCVDKMGVKIRGSMGAAENVNCSMTDARSQIFGRSIDSKCEKLECAAVCEYGFELDGNGCPTCNCDDPCEGYLCPEDEECVAVREANCVDFLCPTLPVCRPKTTYANPCRQGTPLSDDISGSPITCDLGDEKNKQSCPNDHTCTAVAGSTQSVCCPIEEEEQQEVNDDSSTSTVSPDDYFEEQSTIPYEKLQTMCQYLHDFSENMEGTRDGMSVALPQPKCDSEGNYEVRQCSKEDCWCVDQFGTEIPKTRGRGDSAKNCSQLRSSMECLDLTCRMGCDYGFVLDEETGCPSCQCRDPCSSIKCKNDEQCQLVEVSCKDHYCPPVPACLPKKIGQCPYLIPATSTSCDFECNSDLTCNGTARCCSNGCGTQCLEPLLLTACQHQQMIAQHHAHESGIPANRIFIPKCKEDGQYESLQCDPGKNECWCVDFRGFELSQTRKRASANFDCEYASKYDNHTCPLLHCVEDCEHGFELNEKGCRTCNCIEPCSKIRCREDGETCRTVNIECVSWPCPPLPMCLPQKENPCQNGEPLKYEESNEVTSCGPDYETCPSSHKCQLSPLGEYAVCCPKPRDVCFEPLDKGVCSDDFNAKNLTRYHFNPRTNKCESFIYNGCQGNHNNFHSLETCNEICPVLSQCERLREKNQRASIRYKKPTFAPRCDVSSGNWEPVQCLEHVNVCWCVTPQGEPLKGTLTRGKEPECNFRQARGRSRMITDPKDTEIVWEELLQQLGSLDENDSETDFAEEENEIFSFELPLQTRCESLRAQCDSQGRFLPAQCLEDTCWCVDEAGNQLPQTDLFNKGERLCLPTPIEKVDVTIGVKGDYDDISAMTVVHTIQKLIKNLKGTISNDEILAEPTSQFLFVKFSLIGNKKVDIAYRIEQMVRQGRLPGVQSDITKSRFTHQLGQTEPLIAERVIALEHREIVSQSPVSVVAPYHTALIVIAAGSAFVISILILLVILYRRKVSQMHNLANKIAEEQRYIANRPIYIELPSEKTIPQTVK